MSGVGSSGITLNESEVLIKKLFCSPDLFRALTWQEIDGVRRIIKIEYTSVMLNVETGSTIKLTRNFTYQSEDPFDLITIIDSLEVLEGD